LRGRLHHDILSVGSAKLLSGTVSFLIRIYTVRFLAPAGYGALSLGLNCLTLFDALIGTALDLGTMGLITAAGACEGAQIRPQEKASIRLKLTMAAALLLFFAVAGEWMGYRFLHGPGGRSFFLVLTAGGACILVVRSVQLYFQARLRFRVFAGIDLAHTSLRVLLVGFVLFHGAASAVSILACFAIAPAVIVTVAFVYGKLAAGWSQVRARWPDARDVLRKSGPILASFGVSSIVSRMDVFLLALWSDPVQLGLYGAALTIATVPEVLGVYLAPVFLPRILPACRSGHFLGLFRRLHLLIGLAVGALLVLGLFAARPVLSMVLPAKYSLSIDLVLILIPGTLAAASFFPLTLNFLMLTRPRSFLIVDSIAAPLLAVAYFVFLPANGAVAAAWITCFYRIAKAAAVQAWAYALARRTGEPAPATVTP
jgi:O-antigen/teichoic acid export membrane protein